MLKRMASLCGMVMLLLAACSGGTPTDQALPTLAQLPTAAPSATPVSASSLVAPVQVSPAATEAPTQILFPTALEPKAPADATNPPSEPTATLLPIPDDSQPSIFPTLMVGEDTILQGQMTIVDDTHATLTDSEGNTMTVLIDPFAAQIGANQLVRIGGTVESEGDHLVLRMTQIDVLSESTAEPDATAEATAG